MERKIFIFFLLISTVNFGQDTKLLENIFSSNDLNDIRANQPKNFTVTSSGNSVTLTWNWNTNSTISGFKIYRSPNGQEPWTRPTGGKFFDPSAHSFVDDKDNLQQGTKYYILVQAFL